MSSFRDTFTKGEKKEPLLDYDDSAFLYFFCTLLLIVLVPWTYSLLTSIFFPAKKTLEKKYPSKTPAGQTIRYCQTSFDVNKVDSARKEAKKWSNIFSKSNLIQLVIVGLLWWLLCTTAVSLGQKTEIKAFDPFEILGITAGATDKEIKRAYRGMSLKYHPDKNINDPHAPVKFMLITKAYAALTDEIAKANYEKYGNPDGPGSMKVGIGLPRFLLDEEYHLLILSIFFIVLLFVLPMAVIMYWQKQKKFAPNGVQVETLQFLNYFMNEGTRIGAAPELLAATAESREIPIKPTDNAQMKPLIDAVDEPKKRQFNHPAIVKNYFLILAHMQRLHNQMSPSLRADLDTILKAATKITTSMVEIATVRDWMFTAQHMLQFRRCLVQGLEPLPHASLMQIPHFDAEVVKHVLKGKNSVKELGDFIAQAADERKGLINMTPQQIADVNAFCQHVPDVDVNVKVVVEDETDIVQGDVASVVITMTRKNLREGEAAGPVHAPLFPSTKWEEWWFFVNDKQTGSLIAFTRTKNPDRVVEERIQFQANKLGKHNMVVVAMCDSYLGLDKLAETEFIVKSEEEVKREIYVHPEDIALDQEPTLFQQLMGQMQEDSDDEMEEDPNAPKDGAPRPASNGKACQDHGCCDSDSD
eukprot:GDKI01038725.1.p1 GENE.GDKI01038725.1~~GDKI01038725.1.p1  ORF type:complete len:642 (-),score=255.09 GDKI01038725.1:386-2311(-)